MLDQLIMSCCLSPQVLYQLFDWPNQPGSRLGIIGISNTHDLDQRVLPRIASRLDQAKLAFAPYSVAQLQEIVKGRLDASGVAAAVEDSAVQLACRKVASETGEAGPFVTQQEWLSVFLLVMMDRRVCGLLE